MDSVKIMAIILVVAGFAGILYGKFSYTKETHDIKLGPIEMSIAEKETVNIPVWVGLGAIAGGGGLLFYSIKKK
ncbi:MAG: LPXTG cell wall anchor domain-containing protein [Proteobacteria bacterium]|nr:LPXTG cell wall anchor domain-containing protein [Pseudomonadota bacterium]MBU4470352.1 LPXTG cell wall anchor domain-containing protein [Pseudomonadota bacterium]MCG2752763.1 LPXTG cell wall anchor domain-containing protein [Desulfobacteraceae bacterium]